MIINHNMNAMNAHRNMSMNTVNSGKSMEKLSSGLRINRAGDDAAGLAISEKMRGQIRGLDQATRNSQDGISMIQTAEGSLNETHSILQRMKELATQAGNDTNNADDRGQIQKEMNQLTSEINRIGNTTEFNTQKLLDGHSSSAIAGKKGKTAAVTIDVAKDITIDGKTYAANTFTSAASLVTTITADGKYTATSAATGKIELEQKTGSADLPTVAVSGTAATVTWATTGVTAEPGKFTGTLQIGANNGQAFNMEINDMRSKALGISGATTDTANVTGASFTAVNGVTNGTDSTPAESALDISDHNKATAAIEVLDKAINTVSTERSKLGAYQNRLEHTIGNLGTSSENLQAAESRVRDVDMAKEMMNFSKNNILSQASQAMLAQAKSQPEAVLQLLR